MAILYYLTHPLIWLGLQICLDLEHSRWPSLYLCPYFVCMVVSLNPSGILFMVSEQLIFFIGWGCQPHAQPPAVLEGRCFLLGLSPLAVKLRF